MSTDADTPVVARVRALVAPIIADLGLTIYDLEHRGGTLRLALESPAGSPGGVTMDQIELASRLVSKELDAHDPIPSRYQLEVTSPGVERSLRTPDHFRRAVGDEVTVRLQGVEHDERRVSGVLTAADDMSITVDVDGNGHTIDYAQIDRARTVFEWGPAPKPGSAKKPASKKPAAKKPAASKPATRSKRERA